MLPVPRLLDGQGRQGAGVLHERSEQVAGRRYRLLDEASRLAVGRELQMGQGQASGHKYRARCVAAGLMFARLICHDLPGPVGVDKFVLVGVHLCSW